MAKFKIHSSIGTNIDDINWYALTNLRHYDCCRCWIGAKSAASIMLIQIYKSVTCVMLSNMLGPLKPLNKQCVMAIGGVGNPSLSLLLTGSFGHSDNGKWWIAFTNNEIPHYLSQTPVSDIEKQGFEYGPIVCGMRENWVPPPEIRRISPWCNPQYPCRGLSAERREHREAA